MTKRHILSALFGLLLTVGAFAQKIYPQPQQASYAEKAFDNNVALQLVGAEKADADAVALLKSSSLNLTADAKVRLVIGEAGDKAVKAYVRNIPTQAEGYYLSITDKEIVVAGRDESGTFYGVQTLLLLMRKPIVKQCQIKDWPSVACRGVIEGFYGNPWSHQDRLRQFEFYGQQKMNTYVYGPKDDPYHRAHWRDAYPEEEAQRLRELVDAAHRNKVQFVWAIHPGGDIQWNLQDSMAVVSKLEKMYELGVRTFAVFFDDIWGEGARGEKQAGLLNYVTDRFVHRHSDVQPLIMCPTQYNKAWSGGDYLTTLGNTMYPEVRIMWTGNSVVDMIESDDMEWINGQIGRKAFIWLNYPVNDYCQSRLLMGKTYGNGKDIADMVSGFCSNPMEYAEASKVSLFSIADYTWNMTEYDAETSWKQAMEALMPTASQAFRFFCNNNIDLGKTGHGLRREGESADFLSLTSGQARLLYFNFMQTYAHELMADSVNHPEMVAEILPWLQSMSLLGQRGEQVYMMQSALDDNDSVAFIGHYRAQLAADRQQKAITSRNFKGSIVKAKPVVSGDVITPWVNEQLLTLIKEYRSMHTYGVDEFPVQSIPEGEYFIRVNGMYLTDAQAAADRVGDYPIFVADRDVVNPQRQQWLIEQDAKTGRYRITNKQDGRYLNEMGTFWHNREQNPYDPTWHTFLITAQGGKYSIQCAGNAGNAYWSLNGNRLGMNTAEQLIFTLEPVR